MTPPPTECVHVEVSPHPSQGWMVYSDGSSHACCLTHARKLKGISHGPCVFVPLEFDVLASAKAEIERLRATIKKMVDEYDSLGLIPPKETWHLSTLRTELTEARRALQEDSRSATAVGGPKPSKTPRPVRDEGRITPAPKALAEYSAVRETADTPVQRPRQGSHPMDPEQPSKDPQTPRVVDVVPASKRTAEPSAREGGK